MHPINQEGRTGHHPEAELLMDYAAGSLPEPLALLVATHASICRTCQAEIGRWEALGGSMLESLEEEPVDAEAVDRMMARLEVAPTAEPEQQPAPRRDPVVPRPLSDYLDGDLASLAWKKRGSLSEVAVLPDQGGFKTRLYRIRPGTAMPQHSHEGREFTLLLAGGFSDETGHYLRGDVAAVDSSVDHRPVADPGEDCICLAVTDAPLRLTGPLGRFLNPFARL